MAAILSTAPQTVKPVREIPQDSAAKTTRERYGRSIGLVRRGAFLTAEDASNVAGQVIRRRWPDGKITEQKRSL
jgi:hypothetical protein